MVILGMGKLGAHELNLSSDIDLIFGYPEGGETQGVKRPLDNQEFFIRLGQKLIKALDRSEEHTSELQSLMRISYAVFCLKKKTHTILQNTTPKTTHTTYTNLSYN